MSIASLVPDWSRLQVLFIESEKSDLFIRFLENYERYVRYACIKRFGVPNETEEVVSAVRIRLVEALQNKEFRIRVSVEAFLKSLIYQEVRDLFKEQKKHGRLKQIQLEEMAEIPDPSAWIIEEDSPELDPLIAERMERLNQAFEQVRSQVAEKTWNLFWDITINDMPTAEAALKHGKQYFAAHKANARILQRVREEGKKRGLG